MKVLFQDTKVFQEKKIFMQEVNTVKFDMCILNYFHLCNIERTVYIFLSRHIIK